MTGDAELVVAARTGDEAAFGAIYDRYADRLHDFCHSVLRDRDEAADATHDTFVLAAQRLGQLRDPAKLRPWLFAIARHEAVRRGKARSRAIPTEDAGADLAAPDRAPDDAVSDRDAAAIVWDAAAGLSERDRVLLDLHLRQGLDGQELADAIGTSASQAYVLMSRLRDQVERSLGALLVARLGRDDCSVLQKLLEPWDGTFSPLWRKRVARHVDSCAFCSDKRKSLVSPLSLLAAAPLVPAPALLGDRTLDDMRNISHSTAPGWRRPSAREGFPPPMVRTRRRPIGGGVAAAAVVVIAVVLTQPFSGSGTEVIDREPRVAVRAPAVTSTTVTTVAPVTTTTPAPPTTQRPSTPPPAPVVPPADVSGPALSLSQQYSCISNTDPGNTLYATASDPSGVASATIVVTSSAFGVVHSGPMSGSGGSYSYFYATQYDPTPQTVSWTVTATDGKGNSTQRTSSFGVKPGGTC